MRVSEESVLDSLMAAAMTISVADAAAVLLLGDEGRLQAAARRGLPDDFPLAESPPDREALSGRPALGTPGEPGLLLPEGFSHILCVPLTLAARPLGVLRVYRRADPPFASADAERLLALAALGAAALQAARGLTEMERVEAAKSRFIHVATHELRSPIAVAQSLVRNVVRGYAGPLTDQQKDLFTRISARLDFLEHLVNDLLDLAASRAPELAEEEGPVAVNSSVGRAVLLLLPRAEEKGVTLTVQPCCEELAVWATEEGLDRIFVNLVENGIKYTPPGGRVTVSLGRDGDEIRVRVADTGIGIPPEAMPHLFEEFYRAPNARAVNAVGTGLGLTIVKELVERYRGRIEVESEVGKGTTFTVTFPAIRAR
ncbi:MAG: ATP-binding protein [Anaerolineae bacterium]|nr:ATP-binding protein [Anaerolineae bacterium]